MGTSSQVRRTGDQQSTNRTTWATEDHHPSHPTNRRRRGTTSSLHLVLPSGPGAPHRHHL